MPDEPTDQPDTTPPPDEDALSDAVGDLDPDAPDAPGVSSARQPTAVLCPYCGHTQAKRPRANKCDVCGGLFEPLSRKATQVAMGPWFLRDQRNPFRPGCSFDVIKRLLEQGKIGPTTVVRGPTTRQFWSIARNVLGLAHHLGYCHACRGHIEAGLSQCPLCDAEFKDPPQRNELGLMYPNRRAAEIAQRSLDRQLALLQGKDIVGIDTEGQPVEHHPEPPPPEVKKPAPDADDGRDDDAPADLLDDALGMQTAPAAQRQDVSALDFTPDDATREPVVSAEIPAAPASPHADPFAAPVDPPARTYPGSAPGETPSRPWVLVLLVSLNVLVALGILAYFLMRGEAE